MNETHHAGACILAACCFVLFVILVVNDVHFVLAALVAALLGAGSYVVVSGLWGQEESSSEASFPVGLELEQAEALQGEVRRLMRTGQRIRAIKLIREQTDLGLRDSRTLAERVDDWEFIDPSASISVVEKGSAEEARAVPRNVRQAVLDRDDYICRYCGRRSQTMEVDHVIPVSQGGTSTLDNLVTSCRDCNRRKADRTPEEAGMEVLPVRTRRRDRR